MCLLHYWMNTCLFAALHGLDSFENFHCSQPAVNEFVINLRSYSISKVWKPPRPEKQDGASNTATVISFLASTSLQFYMLA